MAPTSLKELLQAKLNNLLQPMPRFNLKNVDSEIIPGIHSTKIATDTAITCFENAHRRGASIISFSASVEGSNLTLTAQDDGVQMPRDIDSVNPRLPFSTVRSMVEDVGGRITIDPRKKRVVLTLPL
jgi:hypothetical protein